MTETAIVARDGQTHAAGDRRLALTANAARRIAELRAQEGDPQLMLRLTVSGGGCSGFQYQFSFDRNVGEDDLVFERNGVRLVTDDVSLDLLSGSEVDFVEDLMGAYFAIRNPNAASSCGCGSSFAI